MTRREVARIAAPAAFLLAVTIAVLLIRSALHAGAATPVRETVTHATAPKPPAKTTKKKKAGKPRTTDVVRSGDTLSAIAARDHTDVETLESLNPGVDPRALHVGQTIRIR